MPMREMPRKNLAPCNGTLLWGPMMCLGIWIAATFCLRPGWDFLNMKKLNWKHQSPSFLSKSSLMHLKKHSNVSHFFLKLSPTNPICWTPAKLISSLNFWAGFCMCDITTSWNASPQLFSECYLLLIYKPPYSIPSFYRSIYYKLKQFLHTFLFIFWADILSLLWTPWKQGGILPWVLCALPPGRVPGKNRCSIHRQWISQSKNYTGSHCRVYHWVGISLKS